MQPAERDLGHYIAASAPLFHERGEQRAVSRRAPAECKVIPADHCGGIEFTYQNVAHESLGA